jgi:Enoyl-CoA hydratase/isomerase
MHTRAGEMLGADELGWRLRLDEESLVGEPPVVLVDLSIAAGERVPEPGSLPAVVVGVGVGEPAGDAAANCDVVTDEPAVVAAIVDRTGRSPRAAVALALLMRGRDRRTVEDSLVAESATYSVLQSGPDFAAWRNSAPLRIAADVGPPVLVERRGTTLHVVLHRPRRHNAYSIAMRDHLVEALRVAAADPSLTVVLSGDGPSFCSGGDLAEFGSFADPATAHMVRLTRSAARLLYHIGPRLEARVHGACFGAGVELAAFAGTVVARPDAVFALPELDLGLVPGAGGTASLPPRIGRRRTTEMALTGRRLDAATALRWGLIDRIE